MRTKSFSWALLAGVLGLAGCGPVSIRALTPAADGNVDTDASIPPGRCTTNDQCASGEYCAGNGCGTLGSCAARPEACPAIYGPVCGCDGRTYGNGCEAASNGARVASQGECGTPTDGGVDAGPGACVTSGDCGEGNACVYPDNACARSGSCQPRTMCFRAETFCACTGETYSGCVPDRPTRSRGACAAVDAGVDAGPARCTNNDQCATGQYCAGTGCGTAGTCAVRPQACPEIYSPTCGCDGRTYGNPCEAAGNGVRVAHAGACEAVDAGPAGCASSRDCATGNTCVYPDTACARSGTCQPTIMCFRAETFCACTGETYLGCVPDRPTRSRGACTTVDAGVSRCAAVLCGPGMACCEATGACYDTRCLACCMPVPPIDAGAPGCGSNTDCATGAFCQSSTCGGRGVCATRPQACTAIYDPVCGCDGRSYSSACVANGQGVNVASRGVCR